MAYSNKYTFKDVQEKALSWFWVIIFISAIFYLRWLLIEMHVQTLELAEERRRIEIAMEENHKEMEHFQTEFQAEVEKAAMDFIRFLQNTSEYPSYYRYLPPKTDD